jgi:uncharacterized membrane protein YkvA (DUF1232 family)
MTVFTTWRQQARRLKLETYTIYLAYRDPRVPWYARLFTACVVAYAFSPIDLIPDPIPVLGYLDDLILIPLGITLALKMIPPALIVECRERAQTTLSQRKPTNWVAAGIIIAIWLLLAALTVVGLVRFING